jgi:hypothetical protein
MRSRFRIVGLQLAIGLAAVGCTPEAAPTLSLFGSYFPMWIPCGVLGVIAAALTRIVLQVTGLSGAVPAQLLVCTSVGLIVACCAWLWLGQ